MRLKKINEFFDSEDWKDQYEIPYLKGEMGDEISKFKKIPLLKDIDESTELVYQRLLIEYPILEKFNFFTQRIDDTNMIALHSTSVIPVDLGDGHKSTYYAQFAFHYSDDIYLVNVVLKDVKEDDQRYWEINDYQVDNMKEFYEILDSFMKVCHKLNIINKEYTFNPRRN